MGMEFPLFLIYSHSSNPVPSGSVISNSNKSCSGFSVKLFLACDKVLTIVRENPFFSKEYFKPSIRLLSSSKSKILHIFFYFLFIL